MKLRLTNGYPYPFPSDLPPEEQEDIAQNASGNSFTLEGVVHFEWKYTVTVEFARHYQYEKARDATGWKYWDTNILEATTSAGDGYDHPAIVVGDMAYCGFILEDRD